MSLQTDAIKHMLIVMQAPPDAIRAADLLETFIDSNVSADEDYQMGIELFGSFLKIMNAFVEAIKDERDALAEELATLEVDLNDPFAAQHPLVRQVWNDAFQAGEECGMDMMSEGDYFRDVFVDTLVESLHSALGHAAIYRTDAEELAAALVDDDLERNKRATEILQELAQKLGGYDD